ncbi:hypothetical protein FB45DRAFT_1001545 [Roridomyces roridus]|uniref:Uncharacterized protein n=1 Tax=Roridomyces roridus TaxID=1738132 RepID=A0AAD7C1F0_9AGAR|nr:hypothetical protein FB45DRAFT_1001545 [Roridomyces roridus]
MPNSVDESYESIALNRRLNANRASSEDDDVQKSTPSQLGTARPVGLLAVIPLVLSFITTTGIASALIGWLLTRRVPSPGTAEEASQFRGALVAAEGHNQFSFGSGSGNGTQDHSSGSSTTMYGLAISTVSRSFAKVHVVSLTTPLVIGFVAYWFADIWIKNQQRGQHKRMPTPVQYGLLVDLCRSAGLFSVYDAAKIADFWLHTTASTFTHTDITPILPELLPAIGSQLNTTLCPGPVLVNVLPSDVKQPDYSNCLHVGRESASSPVWFWGNTKITAQGTAVVQNSSSVSQATFIDGDLAILAPKTFPSNVDDVHFDTFGLRAECAPITNCEIDTLAETILFCPSFDPPLNASSLPDATSTVKQYNLTNHEMTFDNGQFVAGYELNSLLNPAGAQVMLFWTASPDTVVFPEANASSGWYNVPRPVTTTYMFYAATCAITAYNVSVSYSIQNSTRSSLSLVGDPILSNFNTTSALLAALDPAFTELAPYLTSTLETSLNVSVDAFNSMRADATSGNRVSQRIISRYPLAPLCTLLAILYGYGLLLLAFSALPLILTSHERDEVRPGLLGARPAGSLIEHLRARIINPLFDIMDHTRVLTPTQLLGTSKAEILAESRYAERVVVRAVEEEMDVDEGKNTYMLRERVQRLKLEGLDNVEE